MKYPLGTKFFFNRKVDTSQFHQLPQDFDKGDTVFWYALYDGGAAEDDTNASGGDFHISCTLDPTQPFNSFFTVPIKLLMNDKKLKLTRSDFED